MFVDQGWSVFVSTSFWILLPFTGVFQQKCHLLNLSERQFSVTYPQNICLKAQILPRNFYSVRKDKHFWITVPFTHQSNSEYVFLLTSLRFSEVDFAHFISKIWWFFPESDKRSLENFGSKKICTFSKIFKWKYGYFVSSQFRQNPQWQPKLCLELMGIPLCY